MQRKTNLFRSDLTVLFEVKLTEIIESATFRKRKANFRGSWLRHFNNYLLLLIIHTFSTDWFHPSETESFVLLTSSNRTDLP